MIHLISYATNRYDSLQYYIGLDIIEEYMQIHGFKTTNNNFVVNLYHTDLGYTFRQSKIEYGDDCGVPEIINLPAVVQIISNYENDIDLMTDLDKYMHPLEIENLKKLKEFTAKFKLEDGDIVGQQVLYYFVTHSIFFTLELKRLNKDIKYKNVFGGYHITLSKVIRDFLIRFDFVDHLVMNDGRKPLLDIAQGKTDKKILHGNFDDDEITFPNYSSLIRKIRRAEFQAMASVGCPNNCHFCASKREHMEIDLDYLESYLIEQYKRQSYPHLTFTDDCSNPTIERLTDVAEMMIRIQEKVRAPIGWNCHAYPENFDYSLARLMGKANCNAVFLGTETFSNVVLENINKQCTAERNVKIVTALRQNDVTTRLGIIVNLPGETDEEYMKSYEVVKNLKPLEVMIIPTIFKLFAGSHFYDKAIEYGIHIHYWDQDTIDKLDQIKGMKIPRSYEYVKSNGNISALKRIEMLLPLVKLYEPDAVELNKLEMMDKGQSDN